MQSRLALFVLLAVLASATHAHAWGREGHVIVAEIAQHHLTPDARAAVQDLLDLEPDPKHRTLAQASTWPDRIKSPKHPQFRQYAFARKLHYVNSPPDADGYDRGRDCPKGKCVVEAIHTYRTLLRDTTDPQMRLVALKFLAHFVGDVHQPLHVGYKRDRGGNDVAVQFFNQKSNLHKTWDTLILRRDKATGKRLMAYAARVRDSIKDEDCHTWAAVTDPAAWANEARPYLTTHVYRLPRDRRLGNEYQEAALPVVRVQLQRAGVRLAGVLNAGLGGDAEGCSCGGERQKNVAGDDSNFDVPAYRSDP